MSRQIDIKSFIMGILVAACIGLVMGAGQYSASSPNGRFEIAVRDNHAYVLDSATGQVWERFILSNQGQTSKNFKSAKVTLNMNED